MCNSLAEAKVDTVRKLQSMDDGMCEMLELHSLGAGRNGMLCRGSSKKKLNRALYEGCLRKDLYMLISETSLQQWDFLCFYVYKHVVSSQIFEGICR